jgi:PAS domain S-box-containing protein
VALSGELIYLVVDDLPAIIHFFGVLLPTIAIPSFNRIQTMRIVRSPASPSNTLSLSRWRHFQQIKGEIALSLQQEQNSYLKHRLIHDSAEIVYLYDLVNQCNLCESCSLTAWLGYSSQDPEMKESLGLAQLIHPDDLVRVAEHFQRFATLPAGKTIALKYRMRHADGQWHWLYSQETAFVQARDGYPLQILGIIQDLTARQRSAAVFPLNRSLNRSHPATRC